MNISESILKEYVPTSWFHPVGVFKVLKRIWHRLPDVSGSLFITFTVDPKLFANESAAFDYARGHLRRVFYKLRKGVTFEDKRYVVDAPYCVKVEFHKSGWVHFHVIFLTRRFVPAGLLKELWKMGRISIARINNKDFHYLLKYVCKASDLPEWVKGRNRLRVFQSARGFLKQDPESKPTETAGTDSCAGGSLAQEPNERCTPIDLSAFRPRKQRASYTIGERIKRWARMATLICGEVVRTIIFRCPFRELFDRLVLSIALDGRYQGNGLTILRNEGDMIQWLKTQNKLVPATS